MVHWRLMIQVELGTQAIVQPDLFSLQDPKLVAVEVLPDAQQKAEAALDYFQSIWPPQVPTTRIGLATVLMEVLATLGPENQMRGFIESTEGRAEYEIPERFFSETCETAAGVHETAQAMKKKRAELRALRLTILEKAIGAAALAEQAKGYPEILENIEAMPRLLMSNLQKKFGEPGHSFARRAIIGALHVMLNEADTKERGVRAA